MEKLTEFESFTRGGDILRHKVAMALANYGALAGWSAGAGVLAGTLTARISAAGDWPLFWRFQVARLLELAGLGSSKLAAVAKHTPSAFLQKFGAAYHDTFFGALPFSLAVALGAAGGVGMWLYKRAMAKSAEFKSEHIRGAKMLAVAELKTQVEAYNEAAAARWQSASPAQKPLPVTFCGVPLPLGFAQRNILATGGMGSGKSVALFNLADQVAAGGRTMIVYDKVTEFTRQYYRANNDFILNPLDKRFPGWSILKEIRTPSDCDMLAACFVPKKAEGSTGDAYFQDGPRLVISAIFNKLIREGRTLNSDICTVAFKFTPDQLHAWLVPGTPAANLINPEGKGNGGAGILTSMQLALNVMQHVPDGPFSIRQVIANAGDVRLFVNSDDANFDLLRPFTNLAVTLAYRATMAQPEVSYDKYWFLLDEFYSIGTLGVIKSAITEARKFGVVTVIGAQNTSQFDELYGKDAAKTMRSNLQNYVILRVADETTAEAYSKVLGSEELNEQSNSMSWGAAEQKDGASINTQRKERKLVLPSEIMALPDCVGFLKLAGDFAVCKVQYSHRDRLPKPDGWVPATGFVEREGFALETGGDAPHSAEPLVPQGFGSGTDTRTAMDFARKAAQAMDIEV